MFRRLTSWHRRCRILRSSWAQRRVSPTVAWQKIRTHLPQPEKEKHTSSQLQKNRISTLKGTLSHI